MKIIENKSYKPIIIILIAIFSFSCYSHKMLDIQDLNEKKHRWIKVIGLITKSGKWIEFDQAHKGKIKNGVIIGKIRKGPKNVEEVRIPLSNIDKIWTTKKNGKKTFFRTLGFTGVALFVLFLNFDIE